MKEYGTFRLELFGGSHEEQVGLRMELPSGIRLNNEMIARDIDRRRGGRFGGTSRQEEDVPVYLSGVRDGVTTGETLVAVFKNRNVRPQDYSPLLPRPSHADYPAYVKTGRIPSGGGRYSGRMTLPLVLAGAIMRQLLAQRGITLGGHYRSIGGAEDEPFDGLKVDAPTLERLRDMDFPALNEAAASAMRERIGLAASEGDSLGGSVELAAVGLKTGLGGELTDGLESRIAPLLFAIPGVKAVEFGAGAGFAQMRGSEANDGLEVRDGRVRLMSNRSGGINGGMANGAPLTVTVTFRPTPSIALPQRTVDLGKMQNAELRIAGRHDACIALRGLAAAEAALAIGIAEAVWEEE